MTRRLLATGLLVLLLATACPAAAVGAPSADPPKTRLVVVVLAPFLTWNDVVSGHTPYLRRLLGESALGDVNMTSLAVGADGQTAENGALMLSAGTWTSSAQDAPPAVSREGSPAIAYPGIGLQDEAQRGEQTGARPGALAQAIRDAGGITAAIGAAGALTADASMASAPPGSRAGTVSPAVLAAMDRSGAVVLGSVSPKLLRSAPPPAALGVLGDRAAISHELAAVLADPRVRRGPALVFLDPGDLLRANAFGTATSNVESLARVEALSNLDALVHEVRRRAPSDALLVVAAPAAIHIKGTKSGYGPLIVNGPGWRGLLKSSSTRRLGVVTGPDLSTTLLATLGVSAPAEFIGSPLGTNGSRTGEGMKIELLTLKDATARSVDAIRPYVVNAYIVLTVLCLGFAVALLALPKLPRAAAMVAQVGLLLVLAVPAAGVLMFLPIRFPATPVTALALFAGTTTLLWVVAVASHYSPSLPRGVGFLAILTVGVFLLDQWTGARLSFSAVLSYSPLVGARYYGIGNEAAAVLVGAACTGLGILLDHQADVRWVARTRRWLFPAVGAVCLVTAAAPLLGANIGVAIWGTFAFVFAGAAAVGVRRGWKTLAVAALVVVLLIGAFTAVDLLAASSARTHLGKTVASAGQDGSVFASMLARKAATNVRLLTQTSWSLLFLVIVLVLGWLSFRPTGALRDVLLAHPSFAGALTACLLAGAIAYFTEDSGIIVPALLLLFPTVGVVDLMVSQKAGERAK